MTTTGTRRKRPHPARRARTIAGSVSVAGMLVLTGCMAALGKTGTATSTSTSANPSATSATSTTTATTGSYASRSDTSAAVAATASPQINTSTHAS